MARSRPVRKSRDFGYYCLMSSPFWLAAVASQGLDAQLNLNATDLASLRTAIGQVNASATNDTITISAVTINLTGTTDAGTANHTTGDLDITKAAGTLTIIGAGAGSTIIDGQDIDRVFHINNGANAPVTLQNLTIRNGRALDQGSAAGESRGGGIMKEGAGSLTLTGVTLTANEARGANGANGVHGVGSGNGGPGGAGGSARGGAIYVSAGTVTITNSTLSLNNAIGGDGGNGGNGGQFTSTFFSTGGDGGTGGAGGNAFGGGVFSASASLGVTGCTFSQNGCFAGDGGNGGGGGGTALFTGGNGGFAGAAGAARGAGLYVQTGTVEVKESTLLSNGANGGAGGNGGTPGLGLFGISAAISRAGANGGEGAGAALYVEGGSALFERSTANGNVADGGNGGLGGGGGPHLSVGGNGSTGGIGGAAMGGGAYIGAGTLTLINATLSGNTTSAGDGGNGGQGGSVNSSTTGNIVGNGGAGGSGGGARGGGVYGQGGTLTIDNSTVASNTATRGVGGQGGLPGVGGTGGTVGAAGATGVASGAGAANAGATLGSASSIYADNTMTPAAATGTEFFGSGNMASCLIETAPGGTTPPSSGFITGDPGLSPLGNNGGPTNTHAIASNSIARNVGSNPRGLTTDQRNSARNDGGGVDIGSYENGAATVPGQTAPPTVTNPAAPVLVNAASFNVQGTAPANSLVRIYSDFDNNGQVNGADAVVGQQQLSGGATTYSVSVPLTQDAPNNFTATADDPTNTESNPVDVPTITEDSTPPAMPVVTNPATATNTVGTTFNIQGTAEANSLVQVWRDFNNNGLIDGADAVVSSQQLAGGGTNFSISTPITQSTTNDFLVTATDAAGNVSNPPTNVPTITETTVPPIAPPVVTTPSAPTTVDAPTFNIQGTAQANALVRIYRDNNNDGFVNGTDTEVGNQQLSGGATSFSVSAPLAQGVVNNFLATAFNGTAESLPTDVPSITDANPGGGVSAGGGGGGGGGGCSVDGTRRRYAWLGAALLLPLLRLRRRKV